MGMRCYDAAAMPWRSERSHAPSLTKRFAHQAMRFNSTLLHLTTALACALAMTTQASAQLVNVCGTLVTDGAGCKLVELSTGERYILDSDGGLAIGQTIAVQGDLDTTCLSICWANDGCIFNAVTTPSVGCGGGMNYCGPAPFNSAGLSGSMSALGSLTVASNDLTLVASDLPQGQFGIFVLSMTSDFVPGANGTSNGNICLGGVVGRFDRPGEVLGTGALGTFSLAADLTTFPQGSGSVAVAAGETWYFQAWHRDVVGLGSNFTDGLELTFQ